MARLFDETPGNGGGNSVPEKEDTSLERLKELDDKIAQAIGKVKALKEENAALQNRVRELESMLAEKDSELRNASAEKSTIKEQISELLSELDSIDLS